MNSLDINRLINDFIDEVINKNITVYNEFSLQHELGIFLRGKIKDYKIEFERNVSHFLIENTIKKEIDIVVYSKNTNEKYAIELKFPQENQKAYPRRMYQALLDIKFMEELTLKGFTKTYCLFLTQDHLYYEGDTITGIYNYFRNSEKIKNISRPTGDKDPKELTFKNEYQIKWEVNTDNINNNKYYYYVIKIPSDKSN